MTESEITRELRNALGTFATGITVVTTLSAENHPVGMTVNSFSSVSLEPPLVLWSLAESANCRDIFLKSTYFNICVLDDNQLSTAQLFAEPGNDKFDKVNWEADSRRIPIISNSLANFQCKIEHQYPGGDHTIIVGRVLDFDYRDAQPLLFNQGQYQFLQ